MTTKNGPSHVVVDGSNIATEGRSIPSLAQLSEAVAGFMEEHPDTAITVVVDATFGHRIDKKEVAEFEAGISNNELVAPPAGAIGRGDAFVLSIAQKANASILSNDSFQEFHADYQWLFDEGRLIGGKPVPHVGWVFVNRSPVRGPVSRKATQGARGGSRTRGGSRRGDADRAPVAVGSGSPLANEPMPVPKSPPPGRSKGSQQKSAEPKSDGGREGAGSGRATPPPAPRAGDVVNELMPFLEFVEHHPIGTSVNGIVETYSSHGAYIAIGTDGVRGYIPLRLMADPAPTSARKVMQIGEAVTVVVVSFAAARRSIDCALPDMAGHAQATATPEDDAPARPSRRGRTKSETRVAEAVIDQLGNASVEPTVDVASAPSEPAPKRASRKRAAPRAGAASDNVDSEASSTVSSDTGDAVRPVPAKRAPAKKSPATKAPAKRAPAKKVAATKVLAETASGTAVAAKKAPAGRKAAATKSPPQQATETPAAKPAPKKAAAKKSPAVKKSPAAKKSPAKRAPAKRAAAKKSAATTSSAKTAAPGVTS